jgi:hypothetical protein
MLVSGQKAALYRSAMVEILQSTGMKLCGILPQFATTGNYRKLPESSGNYRNQVESSVNYWKLPETTGIDWKLPESSGIKWKLPETTGNYWNRLETTGMTAGCCNHLYLNKRNASKRKSLKPSVHVFLFGCHVHHPF